MFGPAIHFWIWWANASHQSPLLEQLAEVAGITLENLPVQFPPQFLLGIGLVLLAELHEAGFKFNPNTPEAFSTGCQWKAPCSGHEIQDCICLWVCQAQFLQVLQYLEGQVPGCFGGVSRTSGCHQII